MALVVVMAGVGWVLLRDGGKDGGESSLDAKSFRQPADDEVRETVESLPKGGAGRLVSAIGDAKLKPLESQNTPGTWATDKILAKGLGNTLQGFKIDADDELAWHRQLSGAICGWTQDVTVGGSTSVLFKDTDGGCTKLIFFEVDTGEKVWEASVPWKEDALSRYPNVTLAKGVVAVAYGSGSAGFDMQTGKKLWTRNRTSICREGGFTGGRALLLRQDCHTKDGNSYFSVQRISPDTGKSEWVYKANEHLNFVYLISADPVVLAVSAGQVDLTDLITLDRNGKYQTTIRFENNHYQVKCEEGVPATAEDSSMFSAVDQCSRVVVSQDQAFITTGEVTEGVSHETNSIVSFDLRTGHTGVKFDAGKDQELFPLRMSGERLLALKAGTDNFAPTQLVSLDPKTGKESSYFSFSAFQEASILISPTSSDIVVEHGRIFFGSRAVQGGGKKEEPAYTWRAFGVGSAR
ncbi:PQQ-like beta-propeller repeat protein [Streptomyces kunmingensis]|uniref:PQQ-like beta-propeller repeat protein n=1 Tax=Streptomyces kunmingensis TaxID=68225 RepID=A0ABU6CC09_9ACTN|nr:PQQ-binding-like beta-propeller repeat protein [Streptomyces kunmingensis]MEB3962203.1 PQQ-like beta-propeller repeat protein [Streptomyces kunmingensis]